MRDEKVAYVVFVLVSIHDDDVIISTIEKPASSTAFACASSTENGTDVPISGDRALWLQFKAPSTTSTFEEQTIIITVGAQAAE